MIVVTYIILIIILIMTYKHSEHHLQTKWIRIFSASSMEMQGEMEQFDDAEDDQGTF